jgi:hypothetical protein
MSSDVLRERMLRFDSPRRLFEFRQVASIRGSVAAVTQG